jgi:hypothetical protein
LCGDASIGGRGLLAWGKEHGLVGIDHPSAMHLRKPGGLARQSLAQALTIFEHRRGVILGA